MFVDGEEIDSVNYENKILTIPYTANTEKIEVYGSYVIPEFGTITMIILADGCSFYYCIIKEKFNILLIK